MLITFIPGQRDKHRSGHTHHSANPSLAQSLAVRKRGFVHTVSSGRGTETLPRHKLGRNKRALCSREAYRPAARHSWLHLMHYWTGQGCALSVHCMNQLAMLPYLLPNFWWFFFHGDTLLISLQGSISFNAGPNSQDSQCLLPSSAPSQCLVRGIQYLFLQQWVSDRPPLSPPWRCQWCVQATHRLTIISKLSVKKSW